MGARFESGFRASTLVLAVLCSSAAAGGEFSYSGSINGATGNYTLSERTTTVALWSSILYRDGRFSGQIDLPVFYQDTPFVSYVGRVPVPTGRRFGKTETPQAGSAESVAAARLAAGFQEGNGDGQGTGGGGSGGGPGGPGGGGQGGGQIVVPPPETLEFDDLGVGDPMLRLGLRVLEQSGRRPSLSVFAAAKAPLSNAQAGFSTGEWDAGLGVEAAGSTAGLFWSAIASYWDLGDPPGLEIESALYAGASVGAPLGDGRQSVSGLASAATETVAGAGDSLALGVSWSRTFQRSRQLSVTLWGGLTDAAPDVALGLAWTIDL